jgi:hypothetical protein
METEMVSWFWLNIPAGVLIFSAVVGIPLWLVFKQPQKEPDHPRATAHAHPPAEQPRPDRERELQLTH